MLITILAGGLGKRMQSNIPKVLHLVDGSPMIIRILNQVVKLSPVKIFIVVGEFYPLIKDCIDMNLECGKHLIEYVFQPIPLGTGNAVYHTLKHLENYKNSYNLILCGDTPMLTFNTLYNLTKNFTNDLLVTGIHLDNPYGYGRIVTNNDQFVDIVEEKDCNEEQRNITLVNVSIYYVKVQVLFDTIPNITNNNKSNEYYLTDFVKIYNGIPNLYILDETKVGEIVNVNSKQDLENLKV